MSLIINNYSYDTNKALVNGTQGILISGVHSPPLISWIGLIRLPVPGTLKKKLPVRHIGKFEKHCSSR